MRGVSLGALTTDVIRQQTTEHGARFTRLNIHHHLKKQTFYDVIAYMYALLLSHTIKVANEDTAYTQ